MLSNRTHGHIQKRVGLRKLARDQVEGAKDAIVWAFESDCTVTQACRMAHVGRATFYQWLQRDASFAAKVEEARGPLLTQAPPAHTYEPVKTRELMTRLQRLNPAKYGS